MFPLIYDPSQLVESLTVLQVPAYLGQCKHPTLKASPLTLQHGVDIMLQLSF